MSLIFGARPKSLHLLTGNNLRAFQTLSAHTKPTPSDIENRNKSALLATSAVARQWSTTSPTQTAANLRVSSLSTVAKLLSSSPPYLSAARPITLTTRSMAGAPDSQNFRDGKPTLNYVKKLPKTYASMTNDQILHFAELGIPEACRECIVRDVMMVDQVEYDEAMDVFKEIAGTNREGMFLAALPFYFGFGVSVTGGYASIPLTFNLSVVEWFNEKFVTSEMPPMEDLETWLEVGAASWGWMEPVLGQVSFFLLCMQFARSQLQNLGMRPYFNWQRERRATHLIQKYPQYDAQFLANYSKIDRLVKPHEMAG
mmetsp:Transcript_23626/g.51160  ORF Transcript_23626/g.51160 Transcript_23626/m.51160 type:complete len:313 (-) Transcript_23626:678-1616(-)|eukprot:CAMPEP_0172301376 /NCGR_PEP_ID=MMETSP1058-20130122/3281_1 /TAXON_ID=83371 /ORGANISM="Detonula confervacea, Strain CCMP 353" /LENGTH=312 /DNA_ID=CAMNT_0013011465 /DNA_START=56 /DNA_END=994 /DNA_ORIENTATION=+